MISFDNVIKLIEEQDLKHIKVIDATGKKLYQLETAHQVGETIQNLKEKKEMFAMYGRVNFICADDAIKRGNWTNAFHYMVMFPGGEIQAQNNQMQMGAIPKGYVSAGEAELRAELNALKIGIEFQKKFDELNRKLEEKEKKNDSEDFSKYLPMIGAVAKILKGGSLTDAMQGMAGIETQQKPTLTKMSEQTLSIEKQVEQVNIVITELGNKIGLEKLHILVKTLNDKPELADGLINLINNPAKMEAIKAFL
jgi:hypothetical protein